MKRVMGIIVAITLASAISGQALAASGRGRDRAILAFHMNATGPGTAAGTFSVAGALSDTGTLGGTFVLTPTVGDEAILEGDQTIVGASGSITTHYKGTTQIVPIPGGRAFGEGRFVITEATGSYSGLEGKGTFAVVADFTNFVISGSLDMKVSR